jgi:hypothetical protein
MAPTAAVPATKPTKAVGRSWSWGKCSTAEGDRRDDREAHLSQHDMYSSLNSDARLAHPAPFVRQRLRAVHVKVLLQIASRLVCPVSGSPSNALGTVIGDFNAASFPDIS